MKNNQREHKNNYDYMRVFAMCMVILNHIADRFVTRYNQPGCSQVKYTYICESISLCAIPLFLMLTGVFVIDKAGKTTAKKFYIDSAKKLGIPLGLFVIVYYVYDICVVKTKTVSAIYKGILQGFLGMYAHWYMVMLAVIYAVLPLLSFIKERVSYKTWAKCGIVFFIYVMVGHYFENSTTSWSLSNMYLIGYVLMGNIIYRKLDSLQIKNNILGLIMLGVGIVILGLNGTMLYRVMMNSGDYYNKLLNLYSAPLIILAAIIIFTGFTIIDIKGNFSCIRCLANISYIVFLSHKILIDVVATTIFPVVEGYFNYNIKMIIPIEYLIVFPLSIIFAYIVSKLLNLTVYRRR